MKIYFIKDDGFIKDYIDEDEILSIHSFLAKHLDKLYDIENYLFDIDRAETFISFPNKLSNAIKEANRKKDYQAINEARKKIKEEGVISIYSDLQREMASLAKMASDEAQELQTALNTLKRI